jgi:hypothetical protein
LLKRRKKFNFRAWKPQSVAPPPVVFLATSPLEKKEKGKQQKVVVY